MIISSGFRISAIAAAMSGIFQVTVFDEIWQQTADSRLYLEPRLEIRWTNRVFLWRVRGQIRDVQMLDLSSMLLLLIYN